MRGKGPPRRQSAHAGTDEGTTLVPCSLGVPRLRRIDRPATRNAPSPLYSQPGNIQSPMRYFLLLPHQHNNNNRGRHPPPPHDNRTAPRLHQTAAAAAAPHPSARLGDGVSGRLEVLVYGRAARRIARPRRGRCCRCGGVQTGRMVPQCTRGGCCVRLRWSSIAQRDARRGVPHRRVDSLQYRAL